MPDWLLAGPDLTGTQPARVPTGRPAPTGRRFRSPRLRSWGRHRRPLPFLCITSARPTHRPPTGTATGGDPAAQSTPKPLGESTAVRQDSPTTRRPLFHWQGNPFP